MSELLAHTCNQLLPMLEGNSDKEKWEACASEYPWYPIVWLALAKNGGRAEKQKAAIWFNDGHRLHWLLDAAQPAAGRVKAQETVPALQENEGQDVLIKANPAQTEDISIAPKEDLVETIGEETPVENPPIEVGEIAPLAATNVPDETDNTPDGDLDILAERKRFELPMQKEGASRLGGVDTAPIGQAEEGARSQSEDNIIEATEGKKEILGQDAGELAPSPAVVMEEQPSQAAVIEHPAASGETEEQAPATNKAPSPQPEPLAFEPYHVVDYFASQGIKVDVNAIPKTQLDKQMKSFTQWLKTMKRLKAQETTGPADPVVEAQANASVNEEEILTEAMAEVWEKQGKFKKAVEVFEKLLLLHPEKSTFFAARIKELNSKQ